MPSRFGAEGEFLRRPTEANGGDVRAEAKAGEVGTVIPRPEGRGLLPSRCCTAPRRSDAGGRKPEVWRSVVFRG